MNGWKQGGGKTGLLLCLALTTIAEHGWIVSRLQGAPAADPLSTWTLRTNGPTMWRHFATGPGMILAGDDLGFVHSSIDGVRWTQHETGTNLPVLALTYGNGRFVMLLSFSSFATSEDGRNWALQPIDPDVQIYDVEFAQNSFIAAGLRQGSYEPAILRSIDGKDWTTLIIGTNASLTSVAYDNGRYIAVGASPASRGVVYGSTNGIDWTRLGGPNLGMVAVSAANGIFVSALGLSAIYRSTNGVQWETVPIVSDYIWDVSFVEGHFVATGAPGILATSTDGLTWNRRPTGVGAYTYWGAAAIGHRVVVGGQSIIQSGPFEGAPPLILEPPASRIQRVGSTYTNSITVESFDPVAYQWRHNGVSLPGATNANVRLPNVTEHDSGNYSVVATAAGVSVTSPPAPALIAVPAGISLQPVSQEVIQGGTATFSVTATGTPPIAFRWRHGGSTTNYMKVDGHSSFLTVTNAQVNANYTVVVSNIVFTPGELSAIATLTVVADSDHDGLPDTYETTQGFNPADPADGSLDSDGDGVSNASEYLAGTDPRQAQSYLKVERLVFDAGARLEFMTAPGKTYTVQYTDDLSVPPWSRLADIPAMAVGGLETVLDPAAVGTRFYRLLTPRQP